MSTGSKKMSNDKREVKQMSEQLLQTLIDEVRLLRNELRERKVSDVEVAQEIAPVVIISHDNLNEAIAGLLLKFRINTNIKGYKYLCEAIKLVHLDSRNLDKITGYLYPLISKKFETTGSRVERAIRHAIEVSWSSPHSESLYKSLYIDSKPTNAHFISLLANMLNNKKRKTEVEDAV